MLSPGEALMALAPLYNSRVMATRTCLCSFCEVGPWEGVVEVGSGSGLDWSAQVTARRSILLEQRRQALRDRASPVLLLGRVGGT